MQSTETKPERNIMICTNRLGLRVAVYSKNFGFISGTTFVGWPGILGLIERAENEGYNVKVFVKE